MLLVKGLVQRFLECPIHGREVEGLKLVVLVNFNILAKTAFSFSVKAFVIILIPFQAYVLWGYFQKFMKKSIMACILKKVELIIFS